MLAFGSTAGAQIALELRFEHASVLVGEPVHAFLAVGNRSGAPLVINQAGGSNLDIRFRIVRDTRREEPIPRSSERFLIPNLMLRDGEDGEYMVDLARSYDIGAEGRYLVQAEARWKGAALRSDLVVVDQVTGIELASTEATVRDYEQMVRRYSLRYWNRGAKEHLFLRVDEPDASALLGVFDLGFLVRMFKPVIQTDSSGRVVVLHQSGPNRYTRTEFAAGPSEVRFVDQRYVRADGSPIRPDVWDAGSGATNASAIATSPPAKKKRSWLSRFLTFTPAPKPMKRK
jgi:hypothetical protein